MISFYFLFLTFRLTHNVEPDPAHHSLYTYSSTQMGTTTQVCYDADFALSCGIKALNETCPSVRYDKRRSWFPSSPTSCQFRDDAGAEVYTVCASGVDNYSIQRVEGTGVWDVNCPASTKVIGCGMDVGEVSFLLLFS